MKNISDKFVEKIKTHIFIQYFPPKISLFIFLDNVEEYGTVWQAVDDNTEHKKWDFYVG